MLYLCCNNYIIVFLSKFSCNCTEAKSFQKTNIFLAFPGMFPSYNRNPVDKKISLWSKIAKISSEIILGEYHFNLKVEFLWYICDWEIKASHFPPKIMSNLLTQFGAWGSVYASFRGIGAIYSQKFFSCCLEQNQEYIYSS